MPDLQYLLDRLAIQDMLTAYCSAIDQRDFAALDRVFTPDAWIDYTAMGGPAGSYPEIRKLLVKALAPDRYEAFQHMIGNLEVVLDGDRATGRIMCLNPMAFPRGEGPEPVIGFHGLWYVDEYRRTAEGWRIVSRREDKCFSHNIPADRKPVAP